jgi:hypothetical protein
MNNTDDGFETLKGIRCLAYSKGEGKLLVGDRKGRVHIYNKNLNLIEIQDPHASQVLAIAPISKGEYISSGLDKKIILTSPDQRATIGQYYATSIQMIGQERRVITGNALCHEQAILWNLDNHQKERSLPTDNANQATVSVAVSPDGKSFLTSNITNKVIIARNVTDFATINQSKHDFENINTFKYSNDGSTIYVLDSNTKIYKLDKSLNIKSQYKVDYTFDFTVTDNARWLVCGGSTSPATNHPGQLLIWDLARNERVFASILNDHRISSMVLIDNAIVITGSLSGKIGLKQWNLEKMVSPK